jgi:pyruvate formate-lyase/glycerol dehydratase family glycyl radical enzyme
MGATLETSTQAPAWGTFQQVRDHLYDQFQDPPFDPASGLPVDELERMVRAYLADHPALPRVLQKAHAYRLVVTRGQIHVDPLDWYADKLNHGGIVRRIRDEWYAEAKAGPLREEAGWFDEMHRLGVARGLLDMGHISPGWENMLSGGLSGLLAQARHERGRLGAAATVEQSAFYEAVEIVYQATIALASRFAARARAMVTDHPVHEAHLAAIAANCEQVPAGPPRTFHQALQFVWLMHELIEMEGEMVRSMGHFDRTLLPYYRADLEAGQLTRAQAVELIQFFWIKYHARTRGRHNGKNFLLGGQHADGSDVTNELTEVALQAYEGLNVPDPKLSVRYHPGSPDWLYRRVAGLIRAGHNSFVLMNDDPAIAGMVKRGKTLADARTYLPIGCYEPAVDGKEVGCTMNLVVNLAKGVELALHDGVDPLSGVQVGPHTGDPRRFTTFEQLWEAYTAQVDFLLARCAEYVRAHERQWPQINPSPLIAATIDDCLARGRDIGRGGAHYNSVGAVGVALANAADALLALKKAVYEGKRYTMDEVVAAADRDYEGQEVMRQYLRHRVPKWGNADPEADRLARRVADHYCATIHSFRNARGGPFQAALFTLDFQLTFGRATGALPDGRRAGAPLAPGVGASPGCDREGVTALMRSVTGLDFTETPNGAVLDVMLHPSATRGEEGLDALVALTKTFFARGGYALQFNIIDAETLRAAQRCPEHYAALQIRVTGWSVYFVTLPRDEQDMFIARNTHTFT